MLEFVPDSKSVPPGFVIDPTAEHPTFISAANEKGNEFFEASMDTT